MKLTARQKFEKWFSNRSGSNGKRYRNTSPTPDVPKPTGRRRKRALAAKQLFADSQPGRFDALAHQMLSAKGLPQGQFLSIRQQLVGAAWQMLKDHEQSEWTSKAKSLKNQQLALREHTPSPSDIDE